TVARLPKAGSGWAITAHQAIDPHQIRRRGNVSTPSSLLRFTDLEPPLQAGGNPDQRRAGEASRTCSYSACRAGALGGIMTISGDGSPTGAEIEMRAWAIKRRRDVGVPGQVLAELVLIGCRDHVGLVAVGSEAAAEARGAREVAPRRGQGAVVVLTRITLR